MTITRPRLTVRRLMILVAAVGLIVGGWAEGKRRERRFIVRHLVHRLSIREDTSGMSRARVAWHRLMASKYEFAARYPWLPVAPDPPKPE